MSRTPDTFLRQRKLSCCRAVYSELMPCRMKARRWQGRTGNRGDAMEIRYGCFLSYAHGQYAFMNKFKNDLIEALACYLEPHLDREEVLFIDSEQLGGGDDIDLRVARAMCQSVCMIVLYTPKYEAHGYTRREFAAMQLIEQERRAWYELPSHLIIPIIMTVSYTHLTLPTTPYV